MLAYTPGDFTFLETLAKIFIIPARQNQFTQQNFFKKKLRFIRFLLQGL